MCIRDSINNPTTEKTHLVATNDGTFFSYLGDKIAVGGWVNPTTYSVGQNFIPLFNTRQGPGQPILYISLYQGRPRMMLYNSSGTLILDQTETPGFNMVNGGWYFLSAIINATDKTSQIVLCNRADGVVSVSYTHLDVYKRQMSFRPKWGSQERPPWKPRKQ